MLIGIDASRANLAERTGTEWYSFEIIRSLVQQHSDDRFVLYLQEPPQPDLKNLGPNVDYRILHWPPKFLWSQLRLAWEMFRRPPDVLFVPAHTMPLVHPARTVVTIHDLGFEHYPQLYRRTLIGGSGLRGKLMNLATRILTFGRFGANELDYHRWSARRAARRAASIITVSDFTKQDIIRRYQAAPQRVETIYHGLNRATFQRPDPSVIAAAQERFNLTRPYLLFIGRLESKKNILHLVRAFPMVKPKKNLDLVLIGRPGEGWAQAHQAIDDLKLSNRVHVLGWQPNDVYVALLAGAEALTFFSNFEGFGLPVIEAFALGTPVVASNTTSIPEIAGDGAILADPAQPDAMAAAIQRLIDQPALRQKMIERGRQRVERFTWDMAARKTLEILHRTS